MSVCLCVCLSVCLYVYVCMYVYLYTCINVCINFRLKTETKAGLIPIQTRSVWYIHPYQISSSGQIGIYLTNR